MSATIWKRIADGAQQRSVRKTLDFEIWWGKGQILVGLRPKRDRRAVRQLTKLAAEDHEIAIDAPQQKDVVWRCNLVR